MVFLEQWPQGLGQDEESRQTPLRFEKSPLFTRSQGMASSRFDQCCILRLSADHGSPGPLHSISSPLSQVKGIRFNQKKEKWVFKEGKSSQENEAIPNVPANEIRYSSSHPQGTGA